MNTDFVTFNLEIGGHAANRTQVFSLRTRCSATELSAHLRLVDPVGLEPTTR